MPTGVHRLPTLPIEELLGDRRRLKPFARRIGRADGSLTVDEYLGFLDDHNLWYHGTNRTRAKARMRKLLEPIAAFYATFPTWQEGRAALILGERSGIAMTAEQREMRRQIMEVPVL